MIYSKQEFKIAKSLTDLLFLADLLGDEELGHGHVVHGGEVHSNSPVTHLHVRQAEVRLQVDNHVVNHKLVQHPSGNELKSFDALIAAQLLGLKHGGLVTLCRSGHHHLAHVDGSINNKVVNNNAQQSGVVGIDVMGAVRTVKGGAVVFLQVLTAH